MGRFGGPGVLEAVELPEPVAGPGEVVIGVSYADVIFMETQVRRGEGFFTPPLPHVPGGAVGGRVVAAGAGVEEAWVGRTVVARTLAPEGVAAGGGYAERARADVAELSALPYALGLREATALAHDGPTAVRIFDNAVSDGSLRPGARVLVLAAAGGLGALLVQLAKAGAQVIAAARGEHKLALAARKLGADEVVDYSLPDWTDRVLQATGGRGVDVVFDGAGGKRGREALETTARGPASPRTARRAGVSPRSAPDSRPSGASRSSVSNRSSSPRTSTNPCWTAPCSRPPRAACAPSSARPSP